LCARARMLSSRISARGAALRAQLQAPRHGALLAPGPGAAGHGVWGRRARPGPGGRPRSAPPPKLPLYFLA